MNSLRFLLLVTGTVVYASVWAQDGTYTANANASWSTPANWAGSVVADGAGFTAAFDRTTFTGTRTITLDSARTEMLIRPSWRRKSANPAKAGLAFLHLIDPRAMAKGRSLDYFQ